MAFGFTAWQPMERLGNPDGIAGAFNVVQEELSKRPSWQQIVGDTQMNLLVVDVRGRFCDPLRSPDPLQKYVDILLELLTSDSRPSEVSGNSRILFVGNEGLPRWEKEAQLPSKKRGIRSVKSDFEFVIRMLQSYKLAHYIYIGGQPETVPPKSEVFQEERGNIQSALLSFARRHASGQRGSGEGTSPAFEAGLQSLKTNIQELINTVRGLKEFGRLGQLEDDPTTGKEPQVSLLLNEMRLLFQLGKRNRLSLWNAPSALEHASKEGKSTFRMKLPTGREGRDTGYEIGKQLGEDLIQWASHTELKNDRYIGLDPLLAEQLAASNFKLRRYELLRDMGRVLGSGALPVLTGSRTKRVLIIDDGYYREKKTRQDNAIDDSLEPLEHMFKLIGWNRDCFVVPTSFISCEHDPLSGDHYNRLFEFKHDPIAVFPNSHKLTSRRPEHFDVIIIDSESTSDQYGPERLARLANYLKSVARDPSPLNRRISEPSVDRVPRIIAFSQRESSGHVQQCLNLGAWAFVRKDRVFQLCFEISRAIKSQDKRHRNDTSRASHFAILDALKPHQVQELQRADGSSYVYGGLYSEHNGTMTDEREEEWIHSLPKADLHYHIGTAIPLQTIRQLALNTVGYWMTSESFNPEKAAEYYRDDQDTQVIIFGTRAEALVRRIARTVVLAKELYSLLDAPTIGVPPIVVLAAATVGLDSSAKLEAKQFGLGDGIITALSTPNDHASEFQIAALLVSFLSKAPSSETEQSDHDAGRRFFAELSRFPEPSTERYADRNVGFQPQDALLIALKTLRLQLCQIPGRWDNYFTSGTLQRSIQSEQTTSGFWLTLQASLEGRLDSAYQAVKKAESDANDWLRAPENTDEVAAIRKRSVMWLKAQAGLSAEVERLYEVRLQSACSVGEHCGLDGYVCIPERLAHNERQTGLQLYLRGADFLGSAHLQYPDNLLLAAYAITRDNVRQNIIYSEVRCETTGYTKAGMGAQDATDLLLRSFDAAALFLTTQSQNQESDERKERGWPLVRTNILLAAKRHKGQEDARKIVALLEGYLERQPGEADLGYARSLYRSVFPRWWRPAEVVGFDISGDESKKTEWLEQMLHPLAQLSSNITIHAGEAASAESIWHAVYGLNATRIGHGLRLAEDVALLGYCVRESICMEMCPNSNKFTNQYDYELSGKDAGSTLPQYRYPIVDYMSRGLEVSIATDNRYLHPNGKQSLISEYVTAARLVGGLTQWEILQIVKAGFKNAFLSKNEISELLGAVEEQIYSIVTSAS